MIQLVATSRVTSTHAFGRARGAGRPNAGQVRFLLRIVAIVALGVAIKSFVVDPLTGHFGGSYDDFDEYLHTARSIASGGSPYAFFSAATPVSAAFAYPPFAALLVLPLAPLSDGGALAIWLAVSLVVTIAAAIIVARTALPAGWPRIELAVLAALAFAPVTYNYWHGQINGLIFLLLALAFRAYVSERQVTAGLVLGLAAGIKVAPIVLLLLLLRRRWWRASATMTMTAAATVAVGAVALGPGATRTFFTTVLPALGKPTGWIYNQSLAGTLSRVVEQSVLTMQPATTALGILCAAAGAAVLAASVWVVRDTQRSRPERGAEFGLGVVAMLLAGSLAEFPHFTALVIPLFAACGLAGARGWRVERQLLAAVAMTVFVFGVVAPEAIGLLSTHGFPAPSPGPRWWLLLQVCSLPCLAALWLALRLRSSLRRTEPRSRLAAPSTS